MLTIIYYFLLPVLAYLLGSVSFALIISRRMGIDLRSQGSGNLGASNAYRMIGPVPGIAVLLLDILKGAIPALLPVIVSANVPSTRMLGLVYGACAIAGHVFPVYYGFRGGKAVATSCGVFLILLPTQTLFAVTMWAAVVIYTKYISVASMTAAVIFFLTVVSDLFRTWRGDGIIIARERMLFSVGSFALAAVVVFLHRSNIKRLIEGTENKMITSREDLKMLEAEKKFGKDRLMKAGRRNRTAAASTLRSLSRKKEEKAEEVKQEGESCCTQQPADESEDQTETAAAIEELEQISDGPQGSEHVHNDEMDTRETEVPEEPLDLADAALADGGGESKPEETSDADVNESTEESDKQDDDKKE